MQVSGLLFAKFISNFSFQIIHIPHCEQFSFQLLSIEEIAQMNYLHGEKIYYFVIWVNRPL